MESVTYITVIALFTVLTVLVISFLYAFINNLGLYFYLLKKRNASWDKQASISNTGIGVMNPFKWLSFVFSDEHSDYESLYKKRRIRLGLKIALIAFSVLIVNILVLIALN